MAWVVERIKALWGAGLRCEIDSDESLDEAQALRVDSSRARIRLGWKPAWDLEQGLAATVDWYRAHRDGQDMRAFMLGQIRAYQAASSDESPGV